MNQIVRLTAVLLLVIVLGVVGGRFFAPRSTDHINDLLSVGFTMFDPDGEEIDYFDR